MDFHHLSYRYTLGGRGCDRDGFRKVYSGFRSHVVALTPHFSRNFSSTFGHHGGFARHSIGVCELVWVQNNVPRRSDRRERADAGLERAPSWSENPDLAMLPHPRSVALGARGQRGMICTDLHCATIFRHYLKIPNDRIRLRKSLARKNRARRCYPNRL